ncbi:MAG: hypothetical protein ACOC2E_08075 [Bacteroidota bacterium]
MESLEKQALKKHTPPQPGNLRSLVQPLLLVFSKAVANLYPARQYYIAYSIPGGVYGYFKDHKLHISELEKIKAEIKKLINQKRDFVQQRMPKEKILRYFDYHNRPDILELLYSHNRETDEEMHLAEFDGEGELFLSRINEHYELLNNFQFFKYKDGFFLIADPVFYEKVMPRKLQISKYLKRFSESEENMKHFGIENFAQLNDAITNGELPEFIKISEAYQSKRIGRIADNIVSHPLKPRLIFLAGPTSSGKTTSANRLAIELKVLKKRVLIISLDNFHLPHEKIVPDEETGIRNFERITALDLPLFRDTIQQLLSGNPVNMPRYHFDGKGAIPEPKTTTITPDTYVIVEGIHGLNPELWKETLDIESYRLFVSALNTLNIHDHMPLSTSDHRLIRRLVRDHLFRGYSFNETITRWPDVIKNEYHSIFPFQESAHAIFNSSLIYEIAVFAHYAPGILDASRADNQLIREEVLRINRILNLLKPINPKDIPPTSILREFIGGSSFVY